MKTQKFIIMVMGSAFMICSVMLFANPMSTGFTYQGRLLDNGEPAPGVYDLRCKLFDSKENGIQIGDTLIFEDGTADDGYFTVEIDFGAEVFNGEGRYLEMAFRASESTDPNDFVALADRVELTPTPYALYSLQTRGISVDDALNVGIGIDTPSCQLHVRSSSSDFGMFRVQNSSPGDNEATVGFLEGSDAAITDTWVAGVGGWGYTNDFTIGRGSLKFLIDPEGNVGIGTTSPQRKLHIEGPALISAGSQGAAGLMVRGTSGTRGPALGLDNGNQEWNILCWEDNSLSFVKTSGATFTPFSIKNNSFQDALVIASAGVGVGTSNPSTKLDVVGGFQLEDGSEAEGNLLVSDKEGNATWKKGRKYTLSGVLNTTSITATTAWSKIDDFITFSKDNSGTDIELVMNTNARAGTFAGGALGVMFEIRIDDNSTYFDNQGSILVSDGDEFISIIAVFQDLDIGNHTVSVWARTAPSGTSTGVVLDPGGLDGRILVKEVW